MDDRVAGSRRADEWLEIAETRLDIGFWTWDVASAKFSCSKGLFDLVGVEAASAQLDLNYLESLVHPTDRLPRGDAGCLATDPRQRQRQFRLIRPDGQLRLLQSCATSYFDRSGAIVRVVAGVIDLTERGARSEEQDQPGARHEAGEPSLLTPGQVRACRALLDWTAEMLAVKAGVSVSTIRRLEGHDASQGQGDSMRLVMVAFREAGLRIWLGSHGGFCVSDTR